MTPENPLQAIADHLGCTPADVANMTWDEIAAARAKAQRDADQASADLAWIDAAITVGEDTP